MSERFKVRVDKYSGGSAYVLADFVSSTPDYAGNDRSLHLLLFWHHCWTGRQTGRQIDRYAY